MITIALVGRKVFVDNLVATLPEIEHTKAEILTFGWQDDNLNQDKFQQQVLEQVRDKEEVLFLIDLWGGRAFDAISLIVAEHNNMGLITGLNLPMLIEACSMYGEKLSTAMEDVETIAKNNIKGF